MLEKNLLNCRCNSTNLNSCHKYIMVLHRVELNLGWPSLWISFWNETFVTTTDVVELCHAKYLILHYSDDTLHLEFSISVFNDLQPLHIYVSDMFIYCFSTPQRKEVKYRCDSRWSHWWYLVPGSYWSCRLLFSPLEK